MPPDPRKMLLIDGPGRGEIVDLPDPAAYPGQPMVWLDSDLEQASEVPAVWHAEIRQVLYYPVKAVLFGHVVWMGTIRYRRGRADPDEADAFGLLASDMAKQIAGPLPRYRCDHQRADEPCPLGCHEEDR